ncbi:MAG: hypothetical protein V3R51_06060 [Gammaproteobacteria bacterium]
MKTVSLQLVTVDLENGERGVFIGLPLIPEDSGDLDHQVEEIWFSDIQDVPEHLTFAQLIKMVELQVCRCTSGVQ